MRGGAGGRREGGGEGVGQGGLGHKSKSWPLMAVRQEGRAAHGGRRGRGGEGGGAGGEGGAGAAGPRRPLLLLLLPWGGRCRARVG